MKTKEEIQLLPEVEDLLEPYAWALDYTTKLGYRDEARLDATAFIWKLAALHLPAKFFSEEWTFAELGAAIEQISIDQCEQRLVDVLQENFGEVTNEICDAQVRAFKQTWDLALDLIGGSK